MEVESFGDSEVVEPLCSGSRINSSVLRISYRINQIGALLHRYKAQGDIVLLEFIVLKSRIRSLEAMRFTMSLSYPERAYPPFWGPPTTHTDFCEENYVVSRHIAEFINTLTNLAYIIYSVHGLLKVRQDNRRSWSNSLPLVGLFGVGVCSSWFHMTLKNYAELTDSSSMALPTGAVMSQLLAANCQHQGQKFLVHAASASTVAACGCSKP